MRGNRLTTIGAICAILATSPIVAMAADPGPAPEDDALAFMQAQFPDYVRLLEERAPENLAAWRTGDVGSILRSADLDDAFPDLSSVLPGVAVDEEGRRQATEDLRESLIAQAEGKDMDAFEASQNPSRDPLPAPRRVYRDAMPVCTSDGASSANVVSLDFQPPWWPYLDPMYSNPWGLTTLVGLNGTTGQVAWKVDNGEYFAIMVPPFSERTPPRVPYWYWAPQRFGTPDPAYNFWRGQVRAPMDQARVIPDVTGDGICDIAAFGVQHEWPFGEYSSRLLGLTLVDFTGALKVYDSVTGNVVWSHPIVSQYLDVRAPPPGPIVEHYQYHDWPTGWTTFETPTGPKIGWKTTSVDYELAGDREYRVRERFEVFDARDGKLLKRSGFERPPSSTQVTTWLTGAADLGGDPEYELIYDQAGPAWFLDPSPTNPAVGVLQGELAIDENLTAADHVWGPLGFFTPRHSGTGSGIPGEAEQVAEAYFWHDARILGDIDGDGAAEILPTYFTGPPAGKYPVNEDFKTHLSPLDGADGRRVWGAKSIDGQLAGEGQDIKVQGWGYAQGLGSEGNANHTLAGIAVGSADFPAELIGLVQPPGTKFPRKEVRIQVFDAPTGNSRFVWRAPFGTDSYLAYNLMLQTARDTLAPHDWTGDGVRDILTPGIYQATDGAQLLLADARHDYQIMDARTGATVRTIEAWGGIGLVLPCQSTNPQELAIATGHARRIDLSRYNGTTGELVWRRSLYNNPAPQAMTAGIELIFLSGRCGVVSDGRLVAAVDIGANSLKRGFEIVPPIGTIDSEGQQSWITPALLGETPNKAFLEFLSAKNPTVSTSASIAIVATASVAALAAGAATRTLRDARRKDKP